MASGKLSPRQKMINMMYLVLTALLAMNVSSEILNAFKTVNRSLDNTNRVMTEKNSDTYAALGDALSDPQQKPKAEVWKPVADQIKVQSDQMIQYLDKYKQEIKQSAGLVIENGEEEFKADDLEGPTRIMIEQKKGIEIYNRVNQYKEDVLKILSSANVTPDKKAELMKDVEKFHKSLPINMVIPKKTQDGAKVPQDAKGWAETSFNMTPAIAAITILTKLQSDVKSSEGQLSDYCLNQLGKVKLVYDKFAAVAAANTTYCMPGEPIEVSAGVGAFNDQARPTFNIKGAAVPLGADGMAVYKFNAGGPGVYSIPVRISFTTPDGEVKTENRDIKYTVGQPSGAALMLDKMNVFYIGLDNPITVSSGTGDEKTKLNPSGGGITLSKIAPGKYNVRASSVGNATITVVSDGKSTPFQFRVKRVPDPVCTIGGNITTGRVQKGTMVVQQGIYAKLDNFDFDAKFTVLAFEYVYIPRNNDPVVGSVNGPSFPAQVMTMLKNGKKDDVLTIENVRVKGPDGTTRKIPGVSVTLM